MINQIICAAIKFPDGTIIRGHRHSDCFKTAMSIPWLESKYRMQQAIQGFISAENKFVDRLEAMDIQIDTGIPTADKKSISYKKGYILFSEDLY